MVTRVRPGAVRRLEMGAGGRHRGSRRAGTHPLTGTTGHDTVGVSGIEIGKGIRMAKLHVEIEVEVVTIGDTLEDARHGADALKAKLAEVASECTGDRYAVATVMSARRVVKGRPVGYNIW